MSPISYISRFSPFGDIASSQTSRRDQPLVPRNAAKYFPAYAPGDVSIRHTQAHHPPALLPLHSFRKQFVTYTAPNQ
jgi:hypothetical protein